MKPQARRWITLKAGLTAQRQAPDARKAVTSPLAPVAVNSLKRRILPVSPEVESRMVLNDLTLAKAKIRQFEVGEERKRLASLHPLLFGRIYLPQWLPEVTPAFHWEIADGFVNFNRFAIAAPRGSAKTTVATKLGSLWSAFFEEWNPETLIVATSADLVSVWLDDISRAVKHNEELKQDFGDFIGAHWGSDQLEFVLKTKDGRPRHHFIRAMGIGTSTRGRRPGRVILDDPQDENLVKSEKQRQDFQEWFWSALLGTLDTEKKKLTYIGTCMSPETFLVGLINTPPQGWQVRSYALLNEQNGVSIWPEKFPTDFLKMRRAEMGEAAFQQEYQNNPVRNWHQRLFDPSKFQHGPHVIESTDTVMMTVDPAYVTGGDAWAVILNAVDKNGQWHILHAHKEQTGTNGWLDEMARVAQAAPHLSAVGIEAGGGQGSVYYLVEDYLRRKGLNLPVVWIKHAWTKGRKSNRIAQLTGIVNTGRVTLAPETQMLYREAEGYRAGLDDQEDHLLDALAMQLEVQIARTPHVQPVETPDDLRRRRFEGYRRVWALAKSQRVVDGNGRPSSHWDRYL